MQRRSLPCNQWLFSSLSEWSGGIGVVNGSLGLNVDGPMALMADEAVLGIALVFAQR